MAGFINGRVVGWWMGVVCVCVCVGGEGGGVGGGCTRLLALDSDAPAPALNIKGIQGHRRKTPQFQERHADTATQRRNITRSPTGQLSIENKAHLVGGADGCGKAQDVLGPGPLSMYQ